MTENDRCIKMCPVINFSTLAVNDEKYIWKYNRL